VIKITEQDSLQKWCLWFKKWFIHATFWLFASLRLLELDVGSFRSNDLDESVYEDTARSLHSNAMVHFHTSGHPVRRHSRLCGKRAYVRSEGGRRRREVEGAAKASEAKEMRMENTVSGDRWWCGTERSVEGQRLTYLPVAGSVSVRQVENPSVASLALLNWLVIVCTSRPRVSREKQTGNVALFCRGGGVPSSLTYWSTPLGIDADDRARILRIVFRLIDTGDSKRQKISRANHKRSCVWKSGGGARSHARVRGTHLSVYVFTYGVIRVDCEGCNDTTRERKRERERERDNDFKFHSRRQPLRLPPS